MSCLSFLDRISRSSTGFCDATASHRGISCRSKTVPRSASILLVVTVLSFFADPGRQRLHRWIEHQADVYGQEVIHGLVSSPQTTMAQSFQHLGEFWLDIPNPNRFVVFLTYSHPPTGPTGCASLPITTRGVLENIRATWASISSPAWHAWREHGLASSAKLPPEKFPQRSFG